MIPPQSIIVALELLSLKIIQLKHKQGLHLLVCFNKSRKFFLPLFKHQKKNIEINFPSQLGKFLHALPTRQISPNPPPLTKSRKFYNFGLWFYFSSPLQGQVYHFTSNFSISYQYFIQNTTVNASAYVPEHLTAVKGAIIMWNGDGENRRYMTSVGWFQNLARALDYATLDYAILAVEVSLSAHTSNFSQATRNQVDWLLAAGANATGLPNLINAPVFVMGNSRGGLNTTRTAKVYPSRVLGYASSKAGDWDYQMTAPNDAPSWPANYHQVPGIWVPGETDSSPAVSSGNVYQEFSGWRSIGAHAAYILDYNVGHSDMDGIFHDLAAILMREVNTLRHPGTIPSDTPGNPLPLNTIPFNSGWLGEHPINFIPPIVTYWTAGKFAYRPTWPQIAPVANYTGNASQASWYPSELMAMVARAAQATDPRNVNRFQTPKQNPLMIETPARFQR
ncbi:MAG: hypothetical protein NZL93_04115, partial [Chthoniobacterales bacterium]|nr:hypothetical protein [Chthoniobacterales bacterium]